MAVGEFYYNHGGYDKSVFNDSTTYHYSHPVFMPGEGMKSDSVQAIFFVMNNLYEMNNYSKYYAALFTSLNRVYRTGHDPDPQCVVEYIRKILHGLVRFVL